MALLICMLMAAGNRMLTLDDEEDAAVDEDAGGGEGEAVDAGDEDEDSGKMRLPATPHGRQATAGNPACVHAQCASGLLGGSPRGIAHTSHGGFPSARAAGGFLRQSCVGFPPRHAKPRNP